MNTVIIVSILFFLMILSHVVIKKLSPRQVTTRGYPVICAGLNDGLIRPLRQLSDISNLNLVSDGLRIRLSDYEPFVVEGESMSMANIHSEDIVLIKILMGEDRLHLKSGNVIAFSYDIKDDKTGTKGYKLRQFIDYIENINSEMDVEQWCDTHDIVERTTFMEKLKKAQIRPQKDSEMYICSKTWHNGKIDYSFHSIVNLLGKVDYCIPHDLLK